MSKLTSVARTILRGGAASGGDLGVDRGILSGAMGPVILAGLGEGERPWSADDLVLCMDFHAPQVESRVPRARARCRELGERFGLKHVFDLNAGIGTVAVVEWGIARPGQVIAGSGRCLGVVGGIGALGLRLEERAMLEVVKTGRAPVRPARVVAIRLEGKLPRHVGPWDLARAVHAAASGEPEESILEIGGEIRALSLGVRCALSGLLSEMGWFAALVEPDAVVEEYYRERGMDVPLPRRDKDAKFDDEVAVRVDAVDPVTAETYTGKAERPWADGGSTAIHGAFIGSCYGGYLDDLAVAAEILKKAGRVHPDVRLTFSPASLEVARAALHAGYYEIFLQAGAMVTVPGASAGSVAGGAILGEGERLASTMEYHRALEPGQGRPETRVLSSAAAAAAAVAGALVDPAAYLS